MDFASSLVDLDNLPEAIGSGNLGTSRTRKTCESSAHWEHRGKSGPDTRSNHMPGKIEATNRNNERSGIIVVNLYLA